MGSLLKDLAIGAIGYGISEISKSHPVRDFVDNNILRKKSIEEVIEEYARSRGIYTSNEFAHQLHKIASKYEEYNYYDEVYGV